VLVRAIADAGYTTDQIKIGIDAAASSFYEHDAYTLKIQGEEKKLSTNELIAWYEQLVEQYPIISLEDPLAEDEWEGFAAITHAIGGTVQIVGDDLLVTNVSRIRTAIDQNAVNSVLIKLNQIGTVTETIAAIQMTKEKGWKPFVSHRSGETTDTFIADLAVGLSCEYIKAGSLARGERVCKYNRLMEIESNLNK
jgi:enolase